MILSLTSPVCVSSLGPPESLARGFFLPLGEGNMRTTFLIDGFNLYHSTEDAVRYGTSAPCKWLDIPALCRTILRDDAAFPKTFSLGEIHYFSALATPRERRNPGITDRHRTFIRALANSGVTVHLGQFKRRGDGRV